MPSNNARAPISNPSMPAIRVVLVEPKHEGNVGAVARAMRSFDVVDLVLIRPCALGEEARRRAMHGVSILEAARTVDDFRAAVADVDLIVGTSGIETKNEKRFARIAMSPRDLASRIKSMDGAVAIVLGREDFGLLEAELRECDFLVKIPASTSYPILNVSHAASIILYEFRATRAAGRARRKASGLEKEKLHEAFAALMAATDYPAHKRERTRIMFRRLMGRATPTPWEFHAFMGVLQRATKRIRRLEGRP